MNWHLFGWLEEYKDQIGILIQVGLLVATFVLIVVGFKQAKAAIAQAKAADAQVKAALAQSTTAERQLELSKEEHYASLSAAEASTRPILDIRFPELETIMDRAVKETIGEIRNCGLGPALDMEAFYGKDPIDDAGLRGEFVGVTDMKGVVISTSTISPTDH